MSLINGTEREGLVSGLDVGAKILGGRYRLLDALSRGDPAVGLPMLWRVSDGASVSFAKLWLDDPAFPEVRAIWTHEVRSLLRLGGLPSADELFVRLREVGEDPHGFIVVLHGDGREPLSLVLRDRGRHAWLSETRSSRTRRRLWRGLLRVARGLASMHAEGTLHRMLSPDSVFTDLEGECDFRLSGFEWSLRVAPAGSAAVGTGPLRVLRPHRNSNSRRSNTPLRPTGSPSASCVRRSSPASLPLATGRRLHPASSRRSDEQASPPRSAASSATWSTRTRIDACGMPPKSRKPSRT